MSSNITVQPGQYVDASKPRDMLREAADAIRTTLRDDRALYQHYLAHCHKMLEREDMHGLWDAAVNASEVSNRVDVALDALKAMGMEP